MMGSKMNNKTYKIKKPRTILSAKEFFSQAFEHHTNWMLKIKKPVFPFFMQFYNKRRNEIEVIVVADCPYSPLEYAKPLIEKHDPDYYIVLSEAWVKQTNPKDYEELKNNYKYGDIKKSPDRKEILQVTGKSKDGKSNFGKTLVIIRNEKKEIIRFEDLIINNININNPKIQAEMRTDKLP